MSDTQTKHDVFSRRTLLKLTAAGLAIVLAAPGMLTARTAHAEQIMQNTKKKTLIVLYSHSGNTRTLAQHMQDIASADLVELQPVTPYPDEYKQLTEQAKQELESGYLPPLRTKVDNLSVYDVILVGSPNWWGTMSMPVRTFLSTHDLSGKTVAPFITHEGSGLGRTMADLRTFCPNSTILEGLAVRGGRVQNSRQEATRWLQKIGLVN